MARFLRSSGELRASYLWKTRAPDTCERSTALRSSPERIHRHGERVGEASKQHWAQNSPTAALLICAIESSQALLTERRDFVRGEYDVVACSCRNGPCTVLRLRRPCRSQAWRHAADVVLAGSVLCRQIFGCDGGDVGAEQRSDRRADRCRPPLLEGRAGANGAKEPGLDRVRPLPQGEAGFAVPALH